MRVGNSIRLAGLGFAAVILPALASGSAWAHDEGPGAAVPPAVASGNLDRTAGGWRTLSPSPLARTEVSGAAVGRSIYVVGGYGNAAVPSNQVTRYDVDTDSWSLVAPMPLSLNHTAAVSHGGYLYLVGGYTGLPFSLGIGTGGLADASDAFLRYDPATNSWSSMPAVPSKRGAAAAAVIGDRLYVAAGADSLQALNAFEIFDFATNTWSIGPDVPLSTEHTAGASAGGDFYVVGGRPVYGQPNNAFVQRYSPATGTWRRVADLPRGQGGLGAVAACGGMVAFGGEDPRSGLPGVIKETELYDPRSDRWLPLPDMITPRHGLGAAAVGNTVYALEGGPVTFFGITNAAEALDIDCKAVLAGNSNGSATRLRVKPRRVRAGKRTRFRFRVISSDKGCRAGASIRFAGKHRRTDSRGRARIVKRLRRPGVHWAVLKEPGCGKATARIRVSKTNAAAHSRG